TNGRKKHPDCRQRGGDDVHAALEYVVDGNGRKGNAEYKPSHPWSVPTGKSSDQPGHRLRPIRAHERFRVGTWTIHPFDTRHDALEPVGFVLASGHARVLYLTDTAYCPYRFAGLTHVLIEANWSRELLDRNVREGVIDETLAARIRRNHMSLEQIGRAHV